MPRSRIHGAASLRRSVVAAACLAAIVVLGEVLPAAEVGKLQISVADQRGQALPCRIHLADGAGKTVSAKNLPSWNDHFVCPGSVSLELPAGAYRLEVERGPEYEQHAARFSLAGGEEKKIAVGLKRIADLAAAGWFSGDLHVHRPVEQMELLMQAEDLCVAPTITWWNNTNLWSNRPLPTDPVMRYPGPRFCDAMAGEDEREGGAIMYFRCRRPLAITGAQREYPSPMKFIAEARKLPRVWIDVEKPFWWDVPVWLAGGAADSIGLANNHMCRSRMYEDEAWGRPRDVARLPAPRGNGFWSQEIYYHVLDSGLRIPPSAGSASGVLPNPVGYNRVYVYLGQPMDYDKWWEDLRAGRSFVTNGPLLLCKANGQLPGHVFAAPDGGEAKVELEISLLGRDRVPMLEIVRDGRVEQKVSPASPAGSTARATLSFRQSGWFLVRAIADNPRTFRFASTAPFYVEVGAPKRRISKASAQFFLDWVEEREKRVAQTLGNQAQLREVLAYHQKAKEFWQERVKTANAE